MNDAKKPIPKFKTIYSLRVRQLLREKGFEPLAEMDNYFKPEFKCQQYANTEEFRLALSEILKGGN